MKALSLIQPWGSLIHLGLKTIETRTFRTHYRGPLLICASRTWSESIFRRCGSFKLIDALVARGEPRSIPRGVMLCVADLYDCVPFGSEHAAAAMCSPYHDEIHWAWMLRNVRAVEQRPVIGRLGLFNVPDDSIRILEAAA